MVLPLANTRYRFSTEFRLGLKADHGNEVEAYFGRYIGKTQWFMPFIGFDYHYNRMGNTDKEYMAGLRYIMTKYFSLSTHYDSDMGYGGGINLTY
ncbi:hypothetical protein [Pedobacter psychroterrae]|uniref:hypothetical protein n=1 Tax=Pedobacter psychroterrae TaxID=2530453 RepID=UPI00197F132A|nr:hypothetical protein [Pedobacter psychroterrae]